MSTRNLSFLFFAPLLFAGCKSDQLASSKPAEPNSVTNIYYEFDQGPGRAVYFPQDVYESIQGTGGIKVVVIDGHFPYTGAMPSTSVLPTRAPPALDLIDTAPQPPIDLK
jgi:hypothetical protein